MQADATAPDSEELRPSNGGDPRGSASGIAMALGPFLLTVLAALYSVWVVVRSGADAATVGQWQQAAAYVREHRSADELLVFAPAWIDPIGRQYLGDQMTINMAARMDAARYPGIWEVSAYGGRAVEVSGLRADVTKTIGALTIRHYSQKPALLRFDFTKMWRRAKVSGLIMGRASLSLEEVGFAPHRCIKVVPIAGQEVVLSFDGVTLGREIVGYVGLADVFTRRDVRNPGRLRVLVDGEVRSSTLAGVDDGWQRFAFDTTPGRGTVEFRLQAVGTGARDRRLCFAAEARK